MELLRSHLAACAPHWVTSVEGCCAGRVCLSISRVSDLRRIILYSRWRVGTPTRRPLEVSLRWHLSVSGQPSVAPSISLADSRELGASLYSFTSSAGHCPAGTRPGPFSRTLPNTLMEHTHTHRQTLYWEPFTLDSARKVAPKVEAEVKGQRIII